MTVFYVEISGNGYALSEGKNKFGRDKKRCNLILYEKSCAKIHAVLIVEKNKCYLQVQQGHSVSLNGNEIKVFGSDAFVRMEIQNNDIIKIENNIFKLIKIEQEGTDSDSE